MAEKAHEEQSTPAANPTVNEPGSGNVVVLLPRSSVGRKALMAVTGAILLFYVIVHLIGNLQLYMGSAVINSYAAFLHSRPGFLWALRCVFLAAVLLHIYTGVQLWLLDRRARPVPYAHMKHVQAGVSSLTVLWSGLLVLTFVAYHLLHLTMGRVDAGDFVHGDVFHNIVAGFHHPLIAGIYIASQIALFFHLNHGIPSMVLTLGFNDPGQAATLRRISRALAWIIAIGNISFPIAVLAGWVR